MDKQFFVALNVFLQKSLNSHVELVNRIVDHVCSNAGKRIRPRLCFLTAGALGYGELDEVVQISGIIELIHTATLMHDDIVDGANLRRGIATSQELWGVAPAVLVGDFIYSRSFQLALELNNTAIMKELAYATNQLAEGEVEQLTQLRQGTTTEQSYFEVIYKKTGVLFAATCKCSAILAQADAHTIVVAEQLGKNIGMAFQIIDDLLDYQGKSEDTGKLVGIDFYEGKLTLPLIHTLSCANAEDKQKITSALGTRDPEAFAYTCRLMQEYKSEEYCLAKVGQMVDEAFVDFSQHCQPSYFLARLQTTVQELTRRTG